MITPVSLFYGASASALMATLGSPPPVVEGDPHRYWRIYIITNNGNTQYTAAGEIEFRAVPGGPDLTGSGTAIASSSSGSNTPDKAFDNILDSSNFWSTSLGANTHCWIGYDFGEGNEVDINEVWFYPASATNRQPKDFRIEYSDNGSNWVTKWAVINQTGWELGVPRVFTHDPTHIVYRLQVTASTGAGGTSLIYGISEIVLLDDTDTPIPIVCVGGSSRYNSSRDYFFAADGDTNTYWRPGQTGSNPHWVRFMKIGSETPVKLKITASSGTAYRPRDFELQQLVDGEWKTILSVTGETDWTELTKEYAIPIPEPEPELAPPRTDLLKYWFAADKYVYADDEGTPATDGQGVAVWGNLGSEEDATQPNALNRPIFKTGGLNGKPYIKCEGEHYFSNLLGIKIPFGTTMIPLTVIVVTDAVDLSSARYVLCGARAGTPETGITNGGKVGFYFRPNENAQIHFVSDSWRSMNVTNPQILFLGNRRQTDPETADTYTNATSLLFTRQNGVSNQLSGAVFVTNAEIDSIQFLRRETNRFVGHLYEILIYDGVLPRSSWHLIEHYLMQKYGFTYTPGSYT